MMLGLSLLPTFSAAAEEAGQSMGDGLALRDFLAHLKQLAANARNGAATEHDVVQQGLELLRRLDVEDASFATAVNDAYESGNTFWLWQRLVKEPDLNGGILNIDPARLVQLHDHPGAIGMVRILSGQAEVWQFDRLPWEGSSATSDVVLKRVAHRILGPGDVAVLTPQAGNIHALHAKGTKCRMLDFFIPPYTQSKRTWFEPIDTDWTDRDRIACRAISEQNFVAG